MTRGRPGDDVLQCAFFFVYFVSFVRFVFKSGRPTQSTGCFDTKVTKLWKNTKAMITITSTITSKSKRKPEI